MKRLKLPMFVAGMALGIAHTAVAHVTVWPQQSRAGMAERLHRTRTNGAKCLEPSPLKWKYQRA